MLRSALMWSEVSLGLVSHIRRFLASHIHVLRARTGAQRSARKDSNMWGKKAGVWGWVIYVCTGWAGMVSAVVGSIGTE